WTAEAGTRQEKTATPTPRATIGRRRILKLGRSEPGASSSSQIFGLVPWARSAAGSATFPISRRRREVRLSARAVMLRSTIARIVDFSTRHRWPVIVAALAVAVLSSIYAARSFAIDTHINHLLSPHPPRVEPPGLAPG